MSEYCFLPCRICGAEGDGISQPKNKSAVRFWDADDGWIIGPLCCHCESEAADRLPQKTDFAFQSSNGVCDEIATDAEPMEALT